MGRKGVQTQVRMKPNCLWSFCEYPDKFRTSGIKKKKKVISYVLTDLFVFLRCKFRLRHGFCSGHYGIEEPLVFQLIKFATNKCLQEPLTLFDLFIAWP